MMNEKWQELFTEASQKTVKWRQEEQKATWTAIEGEVDAQLARVRAQMIEDLVMSSPLQDLREMTKEERPMCPQCEERLLANGQKTRTVVTTHNQEITVTRSQGKCPTCNGTIFPPR